MKQAESKINPTNNVIKGRTDLGIIAFHNQKVLIVMRYTKFFYDTIDLPCYKRVNFEKYT